MDHPSTCIDVTAPPFNAAGDGKTDDAPAIQKAVDALKGIEGRLWHVEPQDKPLTRPNDGQRSRPKLTIQRLACGEQFAIDQG
jgi:hypothetical protein